MSMVVNVIDEVMATLDSKSGHNVAPAIRLDGLHQYRHLQSPLRWDMGADH